MVCHGVWEKVTSIYERQVEMAHLGRQWNFKDLNIYASPPQAASERFPNHEESAPPRLANFRNNLVGLSQYYNLFFVASLDRILVYQPANQDQYLPTPRSTINLASSGRGIPGYIDPTNPHAVNQLIVSDLGIEELLVVVCDDGDVVAYTTRSIEKEIERRAPDEYRSADFVSELRPFFVNNVGMSAWGVAVHKEARMIAVSSNLKNINVFVFALSDSNCGTSDAGEDDDAPMSSLSTHEWTQTFHSRKRDPKDRSRNIEIIITGHWNNIPNITFFNPATPLENEVFLLSTDIDGVTYIWDVWKQDVAKEMLPALESNRGWGVSCIDPYFCRCANSSLELVGTENVNLNRAAIDITSTVKYVPESSENHFTVRNRTIDHHESEDLSNWDDNEVDADDDYDEDFEADDDLGLDEQAGYGYETAEAGDENVSLDFDEQIAQSESTATEEGEEASASTQTSHPSVVNADISGQFYNAGVSDEISVAVSNAPRPSRAMVRAQLERAIKSASKVSSSSKAELPILPFHILQTTQWDIRLLHSIRPPTSGLLWRDSAKEIRCRSPLHQHIRPEDSWLVRLERLNMVLQIPELGLVAVGDQAGRVALLTMTRCQAKGKEIKHGEVGFRLERFLPLMSQEDDNQRPKTELLGIAVGPISSRLLKRADALDDEDYGYGYRRRHESWRAYEGSRRYRLILYYRDHTVLSYEIGRPMKGELDIFGM